MQVQLLDKQDAQNALDEITAERLKRKRPGQDPNVVTVPGGDADSIAAIDVMEPSYFHLVPSFMINPGAPVATSCCIALI